MTGEHLQGLVDAYVDGELELTRSLDTEGHLRECTACAQTYERHQLLRAAIRQNAPYFKSPAALKNRIRLALNKRSDAEEAPRSLPWRWGMIAASITLAVVIAGGWIRARSIPSSEELVTQEVVASHVRSLMADHLTDVPSSDHHTVKPWFDGKLDFSPPVVDLSRRGFRLVGGRLDYIGGRPVAALVYQRRQHFINLFVSLSMNRADSGHKLMTRQGFNLIRWNHSGFSYWAVSDMNLTELQEFALALQL